VQLEVEYNKELFVQTAKGLVLPLPLDESPKYCTGGIEYLRHNERRLKLQVL